jgi:hypothetical protein
MRDKMKYHTMREIVYLNDEAFDERLAIYRFISQRSLDTGEQTVLLPLMNDILHGKHLKEATDE